MYKLYDIHACGNYQQMETDRQTGSLFVLMLYVQVNILKGFFFRCFFL